MLIITLMCSSIPIRDVRVGYRRPSVLGGIQLIVDLDRGDELVCLSLPSLVKHLEKFFIWFLKDFILHRYLVVLNL